MPTCWKHDIKYPFPSECPRCQAEEVAKRQREHFDRMEEAAAQVQKGQGDVERRHEELVQLRDKGIYKQGNPGEYKCPECLFITLKRGASRCPMCAAAVDNGYWLPIYEAERLADERREAEMRRQAEEWERARPEREREARKRQTDAWRLFVIILAVMLLFFIFSSMPDK
jgi:ribosomal protein L37AE/L43A